MNKDKYLDLKLEIIRLGYLHDIRWAENVRECKNAEEFQIEHCFVVCNSGMKAQIAVPIFQRIQEALKRGANLAEVFGHEGKCKAIQYVWDHQEKLFQTYRQAEGDNGKLLFLKSLPFIGHITKYHLAKNFGMDVCKPDRHLIRIANGFNTTPDALCRQLSKETGDKVNVVDTVLWRAANLGLI